MNSRKSVTAAERFRKSYFGPREPYRPRSRRPRTPEEQADYERRNALRPSCRHVIVLSGDMRSLICERCFGFKRVNDV